MYKYLLEHEKYIVDIINSNEPKDWASIREYHKSQIEFMQHERLVHLLVTLAFAFVLIASYIITVIYPITAMMLLDLIVTVLEVFYIIHYYRLENGVQRWYKLYNIICDKQRK
jgi:hypothetical protein